MMRNLSVYVFLACLLLLTFVPNFVGAAELGLNYQLSATGSLQPADWQLRLEFSQPVSVIEISKKIDLITNGKKAEFKIWNATELGAEEATKALPSERYVFILRPAKVLEASGSCRITIDDKLTSANKKMRLNKKREIVFTTAIGTTLLGHEPYFNSPTNKGVRIFLSDRVKDYALKKQLRIFPPVGYFSVDRQYSRNRNEYLISGKFITGNKYQVQILGGSTGDKEPVLNPCKFEFVSCGPDPEIRFAADRSVLELRSRQMIPLSFANVGNFRCQLMTVPAYFAPWLDAFAIAPDVEEKRPTELTSYRLDGKDKKVIDAAAAELDNLLLAKVNSFAELKKLQGIDKVPGLAEFLAPEFSSSSEGYMGSDDPDQEYFFSLPLDSRPEPTKGGSVIIRVNEAEVENGQQATRLFQVTDLAITYKFSRSEILLWVTSIETGKPQPDTSVMLLLRNDLTVFPGKTDRDGLIRISQTKEYDAVKWQGNKPEIIKARPQVTDMLVAAAANGNDSCFIRLSSNRFLPSSVNMGFPDQKEELGAKAHAFTERGVYKQGETVHWKATMREYVNKTIRPVSAEKVLVKISNPRGEEIFDEELDLSEFGTCNGSLNLPGYAPLGQYNLRVYRLIKTAKNNRKGLDPEWDYLMNRSPSVKPDSSKATTDSESEEVEALLTSTGFQVQEFEPPRHYVDISTRLDSRKVKVIVGRESDQAFVECRIKSLYYTGGPLRHAKVQWTAHLTERDNSQNDFPLFQFGHNESFKDLIESGNSVLDKNGELVVAIPVSQEVLSGLNSIEISATVLDVDARPSTGVERFSHQPEFKVGISKLPNAMAQGQEFPVQVLILDKNGNKVNNGQVQLEIMRKKWFYTQKRDASGGIYYHWASGWMRNQSASAPIKGDFATFDLILAEGGDYLLQATFKNSAGEFKSAYSFYVDYSFASFDDLNNISRVRSDNEIILLADKSQAAINEKVKVRYSLPAVCEYALLTSETDEILSARVVKLNKSQGEFIETIGENCRPNVFFSLIAPTRRNSFPVYTSQMDSDYPRAYFGFTNIKVQNSIDKLKIEIAPENAAELTARPGEEIELGFKITDKNGAPAVAEVAICVVDEAVLSLTGYVTPVLDSLADFMLPLTVFTGDLRTSLISQELFRLISTRALTGGDGGAGNISADLDVRKDFRPVAFWAPALNPDANGEIKINCKLPDSMTAYRIYVVAVDKGAAFASAQRQLRVSKEFYLEPGLPRFLVAGDEAVFPVNFNNKTDQQGNATWQVLQAENLTMMPMQGEVAMTGFSNSLAKIEMRAENGAGDSKIVLSGKFSGYADAIERILPVKPAATIINRLMSGHFKESEKIVPEIPEYVANLTTAQKAKTLSARLNLSTSRWSKIVPTLNYLLRYPYGCLEQTSSVMIPLAAMRSLIKEGRLPGISLNQVDEFLERGVNRLLMMQRPSGGFSYWPGQHYESWWGTQYAVLALTMTAKSGFEFDTAQLDKALSHVRTGLFARNNEGRFEHGVMAMAVVNLAMNGKIKPADLEILKNRFASVGGEASPLLMLAEAINQPVDAKAFQAKLKQLKPEKKSIDRSWYYSSVRENSFALMAILAGKGSMKQADEFAGELLSRLGQKGYWNSTADTGIALLALSQYFNQTDVVEKEIVEITLTTAAGEKTVTADKYGAVIELSEAELLAGEGLKIACKDKVLLNWSLDYTYPDLEDRKEDLQKGFLIEKTFKNLNGSDEIRVGDLVKVSVEFEDKFHNDDQYSILHYLALEDPIPAGFIAVNSSLKNDSLPDSQRDNEEAYCGWDRGAWNFYADHQEIQNDRLLAFKNRFWSGRFRVVYYLRAVCEGEFKMKPTRISLMYDPEFHGMTTAAKIKVLPVK